MPRHHIISSFAAVALALVGVTVAWAQVPEPGLGIRLLEAPSARANDARARSYIVDFVSPGTTFTRAFEVSNGTKRSITVDLYDGAARVQGGAFVPDERGVENRLTSWMTVTPDKARLGVGARTRASVRVAVPDNAPPGEYYGVVWAELPGVAPPGGGAAVANRVGIRVYLGVGAGGEPPTDFTLDSFTPTLSPDGHPGVNIRTCNGGRRAVDLTGELTLAEGPGGVSAGPFKSEGSPSLAPEQCGEVAIRLDPKLPRGPWKASVVLRSGEEERVATATITFPEEVGGSGRAVTAEPAASGARGIPLVVALLALFAVGLFIFLLLWRRRQKDGK